MTIGAFIGWMAVYFLWGTDLQEFKLEHFILAAQ